MSSFRFVHRMRRPRAGKQDVRGLAGQWPSLMPSCGYGVAADMAFLSAGYHLTG